MIDALRKQLKVILLGLGVAAAMLASIFFIMDVPLGTVLQNSFFAFSVGLTAVGLVLMYRTARFINFSQIGLGVVSAQLFFFLYTDTKLPFGVALAIGILAGILSSLIIGGIASLMFFRHPRLVMTVVSIFFLDLLREIQGRIQGIFIQPGETIPNEAILGPWPDADIVVSSVPFRTAHGVGMGMVLLILVGMIVFFRKTRTGIAIRASAENADRASLLGINVKLLNVGVWALVGLMASVATLAEIPARASYNPAEAFDFSNLLIPLTAAVVARMVSMTGAFFTAAGIVLLQRSISYATGDTSLVTFGIFLLLMVALLFHRRKLNTRADEGTSWKAMKEFRPTPRELLGVAAIRRTRIVLLGIFGLVALGLPWIVSLSTVNSLHFVWLASMVGISLVVLTGWSGQISLGQFAIVSVGAFCGGYLMQAKGWPFLLGLLVGGLSGALFSLLIGLPALRIRGLFLAASTFSVATIVPLLLFDPEYLGDITPMQDIPRPKFFFLNFDDDRSMYYLLIVFFVVTVAVLQSLRKSRAGRVLIALRDNEDGVRSFGVDVVRTRLIAFTLSGFIAGMVGALLAVQLRGMDLQTFNTGFSIQAFILVVIGGISSPVGAFLGATYFVLGGLLFPTLLSLVQGILGLIVLMFIPGGIAQIFYGVRDAVLRVVAMRQHIIVPSLFADYSSEAWEKRLAPLSQPVQSHGLAALRHDQRYSLPSRIFGKAHA